MASSNKKSESSADKTPVFSATHAQFLKNQSSQFKNEEKEDEEDADKDADSSDPISDEQDSLDY